MSDERYRNWCFLVYPDSAPSNWLDVLRQYRVPFAVSPLHSPEAEEGDDEKKQHWHVFLMFDNKVSFDSACNISSVTNGTIPIRVRSGTGMYRYFAHYGAEYQNKEQFPGGLDSIQCFNGFDKDKYSGLTEKEKDAKYRELYHFIEDNDIVEYCQLIHVIDDPNSGLSDFSRLLRGNIIPILAFINSRRNMKHDLTARQLEERVHDLEVLSNARR